MGVKFTDVFVAEARPALTIEDVYKHLSSYGGVHHFSFDSLIEIASFDAAEWDTTDGNWSIDNGALIGTAAGAAGFKVAWWKGNGGDPDDWRELPGNFVIDVKIGASANTVLAFRGSGSGDFYAVHISANDIAFYKVSFNTWVKIEDATYSHVSNYLTGPATVRLAVRQVMFSENEVERYLFASAWVDDRLVLAMRDQLPDEVPGLLFGLGYDDSTIGVDANYTYLRLPDLCEILPWATIDPGETPIDGLQRAIADRVIKMFVRADGTLRVFRPKPGVVRQAFTKSVESRFDRRRDLRETYTHVRLYYALDWVETFDPDLYEPYGHRFIEINNTYIEDESEAIRECAAILRRFKENADTGSLTTKRGGLLLEPEDRVTLPNDADYLVDSIDLAYTDYGLVVTLQCRKYAFEV